MRNITAGDIEAATRGCRLEDRNTGSLEADLVLHKSIDMFASRVIVRAIEIELRERAK